MISTSAFLPCVILGALGTLEKLWWSVLLHIREVKGLIWFEQAKIFLVFVHD